MEFNTTEIGYDNIRLRTIDVDRLNMFLDTPMSDFWTFLALFLSSLEYA